MLDIGAAKVDSRRNSDGPRPGRLIPGWAQGSALMSIRRSVLGLGPARRNR